MVHHQTQRAVGVRGDQVDDPSSYLRGTGSLVGERSWMPLQFVIQDVPHPGRITLDPQVSLGLLEFSPDAVIVVRKGPFLIIRHGSSILPAGFGCASRVLPRNRRCLSFWIPHATERAARRPSENVAESRRREGILQVVGPGRGSSGRSVIRESARWTSVRRNSRSGASPAS
jgi:hypothetical protein